jgi:trigger factor
MKMEVTELGPVKRALKIEVPAEEVAQRFSRMYVELNRQVRIPGFRPGKAPIALLEKRYAKVVEEDVIRSLVPDYYDRAIRQAGIVPILVEIPPLERVKIKKDAPFTFTATVEIKPKIELRDYKAPNPISLKPDKRVVTEEQVDRALEVLREQHARLEPVPSGSSIADGCYVVLDIEGLLEGTPLEGTKKEGHLHKVGARAQILGLDLDAQLIGKREGEALEVAQPYPATHPDQRVAGKTVQFKVTVRSIKQKVLPALDDEFARDCGPYTSLREVRTRLRGEMERALKKDIEETHKDAITKRLLETHHFDLPETLVERELAAMVRQQIQMERQRMQAGTGEGAAGINAEEMKRLQQERRPEAERRVKLGLVLEAIAEREGLIVSSEDAQAEIARLATEVKLPVEDVQRMIQAGGEDSLDEFRARIRADKALDFVYRHSVIQG